MARIFLLCGLVAPSVALVLRTPRPRARLVAPTRVIPTIPVEESERRGGVLRVSRGTALRAIRTFPALVTVAYASYTFLPALGTADFFRLTNERAVAYEVLSSVEGVVFGALSIVLGTLVSTAVSVLRNRQEAIRCSMLKEASILDELAQQLVKLFRYDKERLARTTDILAKYVSAKRTSIGLSTAYGYQDVQGHWDSQQLRSLAILDVVAECIDSRLAGPLYGFSPSSSTAAIYQVEALIFQLNLMRQDTRSALNAGLPTSLFGTICALMGAILYVFLTRAAAAATGPVSVEDFLSETVVRALFAFTTSSFFAILAVLSDLADVYTGSNAFFRVDARILDGAERRIRGARALARAKETFEGVLPDLAARPDMSAWPEMVEGPEAAD
mmetsp:Transcript_24557/g.75731  ORF Transcript_24557/g.75731 Transcript_24557/m.75731 type:complete len:387 (-) Transcript_24557:16-1176(-)